MRRTPKADTAAAKHPISASQVAVLMLPCQSWSWAKLTWLTTSTEPKARQPSVTWARPGTESIEIMRTNQAGAEPADRRSWASWVNMTLPEGSLSWMDL